MWLYWSLICMKMKLMWRGLLADDLQRTMQKIPFVQNYRGSFRSHKISIPVPRVLVDQGCVYLISRYDYICKKSSKISHQ